MSPNPVSASRGGIAIGRNVIHSILNTGDHNTFFIGNYLKISDAYIKPWEIYKRVQLEYFSGRLWLLQVIDKFLNDNDRGYFRINAQAGLGKTTFIAWLARERGYIHHFCELAAGAEGINATLLNLVAQLALAYELSPEGVLPGAASKPHFLSHWLDQVGMQRKPGEKIVILVDALDLAGVPDRQNALGLPRVLPEGVYFIITSRPTDIYLFVEKPYLTIKLEAESDPNLADMQQLLVSIADQITNSTDKMNRQHLIQFLLDHSEGVWIYLHYVVEDLIGGHLSLPEIESLPAGIIRYYIDYWKRWRDKDESQWFDIYLPLLTTIAEAPEPVTLTQLSAWTNVPLSTSALKHLLEELWRPFMTVSRDNNHQRYQFYHTTLTDFFKGQHDSENLSEDELAFLDGNKNAAQESNKRIQKSLIQEMARTNQIPVQRQTAFLLLRTGWLYHPEGIDPAFFITFLNLISPNTINNSQRRWVARGIEEYFKGYSGEISFQDEIALRVFRGGTLAEIGQREHNPEIMQEGANEYQQAIRRLKFASKMEGAKLTLEPELLTRLYLGAALLQRDLVMVQHGTDPELKSAVTKASRYFDLAVTSAGEKRETRRILIYTLSEYAYSMSLTRNWNKAEHLLTQALQYLKLVSDDDRDSYALQSASVLEIATNIYWDQCEWLEETKPNDRQVAFRRILKAYESSKEAINRLGEKFLETDKMCLAQFNAGECLEKIAGYEQTDIPDPLKLACKHWQSAYSIARMLGDWNIEAECHQRLTAHCTYP